MIDLLCTNVTLNQPLDLFILHLYREKKRDRVKEKEREGQGREEIKAV